MVMASRAGRALSAAAAVVATSSGCAQIFGLDDTTNTGRTNSVALTRMSIGKTVSTAPVDLTGLRATYLVTQGDGVTRVAATAAADKPGAWAAHLPEPAPVELTVPAVPAPQLQLYELPSSQLSLLIAVPEHPGPQPAPDGAMLTVTSFVDTPPAIDETFQVFTVGSWTSHAFTPVTYDPTSMMIGPISYAFDTSDNLAQRPHLDKLTADDAFYVLRYAGPTLTGYAEAPAFVQTGDDMIVTFAMKRVETTETLDFTIDTPSLATRYAAVRPQVGVPGILWKLSAAPGYQVGSDLGPILSFGGVKMEDVGVMAPYGNPFTQLEWQSLLTVASAASRSYMLPGATAPVALSTGADQRVLPSGPLKIDMPAGLPTKVSINGTQLSVDGQSIAMPTQFIDISFTPDNLNASLYSIEISELAPDAAGTAVVRTQVLFAAALAPRFSVPPETFVLGHSYVVRATTTYGGYPEVAAGDLVARDLPTSHSFLDSAVFTVTP
jgi:hypothetical protein